MLKTNAIVFGPALLLVAIAIIVNKRWLLDMPWPMVFITGAVIAVFGAIAKNVLEDC